VEAYNDYLKGLYYFNRREAPEAIAEFERALARDPGYTAAYTGLADSYCIYGFYGGIPTLDAFAKARAAAQKAEALEPESAEVRVALSLVEYYFGWDLGKAESETRRAIRLSPSNASAYSWLGLLLGFTGRIPEALEMTKKATEIEPFSPNAQTNVGWAYYSARRFEESIAEFRRALHIDPKALYPLWAIGLTYLQLGRHAEAVSSLEKALEVNKRRQSHFVALLGGAYAAAGRRSEALDLLDELLRRSATEYVAPFHLAFLHIPMGNADEAVSSLERACEDRNALAWWPRTSSFYDPLRSHPRFPSLLARIVPA